jgi:tol-pal system protein YbgF
MRWTPVVLLAAGGCLASKSDIRLLQDQLASMQSLQGRADSLRHLQADSTLRLIALSNDSIRVLSSHLANFQAQTSGDLYDMGRQLITIQELTGQNQRRVQELTAAWEARNEAAAASAAGPVPTAPGDTTRPAGPGPAVLFQAGTDQLSRNSYAAARSAFQDLLTRFPNYVDAGAAQYYIGLSFDREQNHAAADSVYQLVVTNFPKSPRAPTALYKYAQSQLAQGHSEPARAALNRIIKDYPTSDEFGLARDLLRTIK